MIVRVAHEKFVGRNLPSESAYWIGFLFADGYLHQGRHGAKRVCLRLKASDATHIEKFVRYIESNSRIYLYDDNTASVQIASDDLADLMIGHGVVFRKSMTVSAPEYLRYDRDFWRGVVDGDGCIGVPKRRVDLVSGSQVLLDQYADFVEYKLGFRPNVHYRKDSRTKSVSISHLRGEALIRVLYSGASVYLDRKYGRAMQALRFSSSLETS